MSTLLSEEEQNYMLNDKLYRLEIEWLSLYIIEIAAGKRNRLHAGLNRTGKIYYYTAPNGLNENGNQVALIVTM
jgi:hypothetical protein